MVDNRDRDELLMPAEGRESQDRAVSAAPPAALGMAIAAGLAGAAVWAAVAVATDFEIGWIAWAIGAAIGAAYHRFGGRAAGGPILCALLAFGSIAAGKYVAYRIAVDKAMEMVLSDEMIRMSYEAHQEFGNDYKQAATDEAKDDLARSWLMDIDGDPSSVSEARLVAFRRHDLPEIMDVAEGRTSLDEFADRFREEVTLHVTFADTLSGFDLLWIFLGVGTAFRLASGPVVATARAGGRPGRTIEPPPAKSSAGDPDDSEEGSTPGA